MRFPVRLPPHCMRHQFAAAVFGHSIWLGLVFGGILRVVLWLVGLDRLFRPILALYGVYMLISNIVLKHNVNGQLMSRWWNEGRYWPALIDYFPVKHIIECNLKPGRQYIVGVHPHGVSCLPLLLFSWARSPWNQKFPQHRMVGLIATIMFWVPVVRDVMLLAGYRVASRSNAAATLQAGHSLFLSIGGAAEMVQSQHGVDALVLQRRRGFIRLALTHGCDLIPTFAFGWNDVLETNMAGIGWRRWLVARTGIALPLCKGVGGSMMPFRKPVTVVSGPAMEVPRVPTPDDAMVDKYLRLYTDALVALYERHKGPLGFGQRQLTFVE